ncbi:acyltransferase family protein [Plantactinospora mayteni]|nr:acyltransferase family protein [Plantactinospora mayteni]
MPVGTPVETPSPPTVRPRPHLHYLDNLRVAMILLVVIHHAAQAYGPPDWWYFRGDQHTGVLATLSAVGGSFRMSLLFFAAAYLVPRSHDRRGGWGFTRGRLKRLGVPFLIGAATIMPALMYTYYVQYRDYPPISFGRYYLDVFLGLGQRPADWTGPSWPDLQFGHLWFIQNLLALSLLYVLFRWTGGLLSHRRTRHTPARLIRTPGHRALVLFTVTVAAAAFVVRIRYPLDMWVPLLDFIQAEPARLVQYAAFFAAGVLAYRHDWLSRLSRRTGYTWLAVGVALAAVLFGTGVDTPFFAPGGLSWASACWTLVETFMGVGLCVGLLTLFREKVAGHSRLTRSLAGDSYAIYLVHLPIVVALQFAFAHARLPVLVTFAVVAILAMAASAVAAHLLRQLPGAKSVL